jgi:hypothetical protein
LAGGVNLDGDVGVEFRADVGGGVTDRASATAGALEFSHLFDDAGLGVFVSGTEGDVVGVTKASLDGRFGGVVVGDRVAGGEDEFPDVFLVGGLGDLGGDDAESDFAGPHERTGEVDVGGVFREEGGDVGHRYVYVLLCFCLLCITGAEVPL